MLGANELPMESVANGTACRFAVSDSGNAPTANEFRVKTTNFRIFKKAFRAISSESLLKSEKNHPSTKTFTRRKFKNRL
jgi:hypothetical protein